jgi:hypothetical protein
MPRIEPTDEQLRAQIEAVAARQYPSDEIEQKIASGLVSTGRFDSQLNAEELAAILRMLVYTVFGNYTLAGQGLNLIHNVATMKVGISKSQADIRFVVHIHKPITAFLKFSYALVNDPVSITPRLTLKRNSLAVEEQTRRFDVKAKAALAAINVHNIARHELTDPSRIIRAALPSRLEKHGLTGHFTGVEMALAEHHLGLCLEGKFRPISDQPYGQNSGKWDGSLP